MLLGRLADEMQCAALRTCNSVYLVTRRIDCSIRL